MAQPIEDTPPPQDPALLAALDELRRILAAMQAACASSNIAVARRLHDRWNELNTVWGLAVDQELVSSAEPVLRWLRQQEGPQQASGPPPAPSGAKSAARSKALAELQQLQAGLEESRKKGDLARGRVLRDRWKELNTVWGLEVDEPLTAQAGPALRWIREQDAREVEHAAAVAELDLAVDSDEPLERIRVLYRAAARGGPLDRGLENRYRRYVKKLERVVSKRTRLSIAGTVAGCLLIVGMISWLIVYKVRESRVQQAVQELGRLVDEKDVEEAQSYLAELQTDQPRVADDGRIREIQSRLEAILKEQEGRHEQFTNALSLASAKVDAQEMDAEASDALATADRLSSTQEEKNQVQGLKEKIHKAGAAGREMLETQFTKQVKEFAEQLGKVEEDFKKDRAESKPKVAAALAELRRLEDNGRTLSQTARDGLRPLRARLEKMDEGAQGAVEQQSWEERLKLACGSTPEFKKQLTAYLEQFPDKERSAGFRKALSESRLWDNVAEWNVMVKEVRQERFDRIGRKSAAQRIETLNRLLAEHGDHPDAETFRSRLPYLEAVARRDAAGKPIEAPLKALFSEPLIKDTWMVEVEGLRYYFKQDPRDWDKDSKPRPDPKGTRIVGAKYLAATDMSEKQRSFRARELGRVGHAPQSALATNVRAALDALSDDNWERTFTGIVKAVHSDQSTDSLLRLNLLRQVVPVACQGSLPLAKAMARHLEVLKQSEANAEANWVDPEDADGQTAREQAQTDLGQFPDIKAATQAAVEEVTTLHPSIGTEYLWVGWIQRKEGGAWECVLQSTPAAFGTIVVLYKVDGKMAVAPVGRLTQAKATVDAKPGPALLEGRPAFLAVPPVP